METQNYRRQKILKLSQFRANNILYKTGLIVKHDFFFLKNFLKQITNRMKESKELQRALIIIPSNPFYFTDIGETEVQW